MTPGDLNPRRADGEPMFVVQFPEPIAPRGMAEARRVHPPEREEWQADGTWTGLFDLPPGRADAFLETVEAASDGTARVREIESEDEIVNHRMAFLFTEDQRRDG